MIMFEIVVGWFALSILTATAWSIFRTYQKRRAALRLRAALEAYQLERARHHHIVCESQRVGLI